jgi:predicted AlkP superfamily phosphohydrolase/phosphomutase
VTTAEIFRITPDLRVAPTNALLLAGPVILLYTAIVLAGVLSVAIVNRLGEPLGAVPGGLTSRRVLWGLAILVGAFLFVQEARHGIEWIDRWRVPLRALLALGATLLIAYGLRRAPEQPSRADRVEQALALGLIPALVCAGLFFGSRPDGAAESTDAEGLIGLAPRFEAESGSLLDPRLPDRPRILLLGLDGASWDRIDEGIAAGRLPTFERLVSKGRRALLESMVPTYSPAIWTSIVTGVPPSDHGIKTFYLQQIPRLGIEVALIRRAFDPVEEMLTASGDLKRVPVTSSLRRRKAVWNLADEAGLQVAVLGLWATWPPEPLRRGIVVSDHASLARRYEWLARRKTSTLTPGLTTYPPEIEKRLVDLQRAPDSVTREELEEFLAVDEQVWRQFQEAKHFSKGVPLSAFRSSHLNDAFYLAAARRIWEEDRPDLLVIYAKAIDELSHFFYEASVPEAERLGWSPEEITRYGGVVDNVYAWTDRQIQPLVEAVERDPKALLIVVSDHGWEKEPDGGYNHNFGPPGILILYGADVCTDQCPPLGSPSIYDVTPTVLARLGLPLSDEQPGRPIPAFRTTIQGRRLAQYGGRLGRARLVASEIDAELTEKLEALGYLE